MNKKYLLSSVTAGIAFLYANQGMSQCVSTQDCTALGYTETSCLNGNGVKCPFVVVAAMILIPKMNAWS